jgi:hypothetical protein
MQSLNLTEAALTVSGFASDVVEVGAATLAELTVVPTTLSKDGRSISTQWKEHQCAIYSVSPLFSFLFLFSSLQRLRSRISSNDFFIPVARR